MQSVGLVLAMSKPTLFLDFDETTADSIKAFCTVYNNKYSQHEGFVQANHNEVYQYNFKDQCPLLDGADAIHDIFDSKDFFDNLTLKDNCLDTLLKHKINFNHCIVTIGTPKNLSRKVLWIEENLPFIKNIILISNGDNKMDKSLIDMFSGKSPSIFLDDHHDNLKSSNANIKICMASYGEREWNNKWEYKVENWKQIDKVLDVYEEEYINKK